MATEIELPESADKRLNKGVAMTVVSLSVFLGLAHVKDDNLVQAMQQAKAAQDKIAKYEAKAPELMAKAKGFEAAYDQMNYHDDQFDAADALVSIAISAAAVAALTESLWVLLASWTFGGLGVVMGLAGFFGWAIHPDFLAKFLS